MLLFEEFFKKKKIDLSSLQQSEPGLFSEFKEHYEQMGEKSFDHTKKFWFNKLRHQFPLPPEVKAERLRPENQIAEQTVSDMLTVPPVADQIQEGPKPGGFKPRFKSPTATPATDETKTKEASATETPSTNEAKPAEAPTAKVGFKPRFKPGVITSKPAEPTTEATAEAGPSKPTKDADAPQEQAAPVAKVGFKPRFKAGVTTAKPAEEPAPASAQADAPSDEPPAAPKMGFKPRFKAEVTNTKPSTQDAEQNVEPVADNGPATPNTDTAVQADTSSNEVTPAPKMGFKPRFKAGVTTTKPAVDVQKEEVPAEPGTDVEPIAEAEVKNETSTSDIASPAPKMGFKPRFKAGVTTTRSADESPATDPAKEQPLPATPSDSPEPVEEKKEENPTEAPALKLGFKPRFKSKPADEQ
ncbi:hypothetical protein LLH06_19925 [Mucilaginibacter daejeonensis]|uniref:hypothetical protein n=1 Tax=Mucilaginibacter daejeonensis TaxID=398049 RepID=UPI001D175CD1|nr:hypothetical protein [Mucilaginibacter daejeonensis]UEG53209.1 hypothetical protein LLH06_19925 [Mucilaginibacter daejeonensis]